METTEALDDPARVAPELATLLRAMQRDPRPGYREGARVAIEALDEGTLVAVQTSSRRDVVRRLVPGAIPAATSGGALFQCIYMSSPPASDDDIPGWIVTQDGFGQNALVLVHEIAHFRNRLVVHAIATEGGWVRAQFANEVAARHTAWLAETGIDESSHFPEPGAFFACAVKIASYPHVYNDDGTMARVVATRDRALLVDRVAAWFPDLARFAFWREGTELERRHREWLAEEILHVRAKRAPAELAEGTL